MAACWTEADVEQLRKLHAEQCSASVIGKQMHRTRNSIIGKLMRLGMHSAAPVVSLVSERQRQRRLNAGRPKITAAKDGVFNTPVRARDKSAPSLHEPVVAPDASTNALFIETRGGQCKYMISGNGPPFIACGAKTGDVRNPWCEFHRRIVYAPGQYNYFRFFGAGRRA